MFEGGRGLSCSSPPLPLLPCLCLFVGRAWSALRAGVTVQFPSGLALGQVPRSGWARLL